MISWKILGFSLETDMMIYVSVYICVESGDYCGSKNILFISFHILLELCGFQLDCLLKVVILLYKHKQKVWLHQSHYLPCSPFVNVITDILFTVQFSEFLNTNPIMRKWLTEKFACAVRVLLTIFVKIDYFWIYSIKVV